MSASVRSLESFPPAAVLEPWGQSDSFFALLSSCNAVQADRRLFLRKAGLGRQKYVKHGSAVTNACTAANANRAAMLQNDSTRNPESESSAILSLGGEEGFEYLLSVLP